MENIYSNYRSIVERAVLAGIITEENKEFYLSALDGENDTDISELESQLNMEDKKNHSSHVIQKNNDFDSMLKSTYNDSDQDKINELLSLHSKRYLDDCQSLLSEDTIENNSILDLKSSKVKDAEAQETDSDTSLTKPIKRISESIRKQGTRRILSKVIKKPIKNHIIDFDVPIYIDIKKKSLVKPYGTDSVSSKHCDVSKTRCNLKDNARILGCDQSQKTNNWMLPRTYSSAVKKVKDIQPVNSKNFVSSNACAGPSCHPDDMIRKEAFEDTDKPLKRKSVHTCSIQKENSEVRKIESTLVSKIQDEESDLNQYYGLSGSKVVSSLRRLKPPKVVTTQEQKYRIRLTKPLNSVSQRQTFATKNVSKVPCHSRRREEKCKHCECDNVSETLKPTLNAFNYAETTSDDKESLPDTPSKKHLQERDSERFLNVNIICKFYPDSDEMQRYNDNQDSSTARVAQVEHLKTDEDAAQPSTETWKNKQSKKIHRLSKMFTNMKINRKQKQPESNS